MQEGGGWGGPGTALSFRAGNQGPGFSRGDPHLLSPAGPVITGLALTLTLAAPGRAAANLCADVKENAHRGLRDTQSSTDRLWCVGNQPWRVRGRRIGNRWHVKTAPSSEAWEPALVCGCLGHRSCGRICVLEWLWGDGVVLGQPRRQAGLWEGLRRSRKWRWYFCLLYPCLLQYDCSSSHQQESVFFSLKFALIAVLVCQTNAAKGTCASRKPGTQEPGVLCPAPRPPVLGEGMARCKTRAGV